MKYTVWSVGYYFWDENQNGIVKKRSNISLPVYMNPRDMICACVSPHDDDTFTRLGHYMANSFEVGMCGSETGTLHG